MAYTYKEAKNKIYRNRIIGVLIIIPSSLSTAISALKMFYFALQGTDALTNSLTQPIKRIIELIYQKTQFLEFFWINSPVPTPKDLSSSQNIYFLLGYAAIFVGIAFLASAKKLSTRLREINKLIENEMIKASITGGKVRQRRELQDSVPVTEPENSIQFHNLYFAPIVGGLIVAALAKFMGLS